MAWRREVISRVKRTLSAARLSCWALVSAFLSAAAPGFAQTAPQSAVLFQNVRVFDGRGKAPSAPANVLVRGNRIERISSAPIATDRSAGTTVVDGGGRTLMPGLIDAHWHMMMAALPLAVLATGDPGYVQIRATHTAREALLRGFTSVRDLSGPVFGIRRAIDEGLVDGPRIWGAGAMISQTSGHADFRTLTDLPSAGAPVVPGAVRHGFGVVADGVPEVLRAAREQLMQGASFLKLAAGGGVSSDFDPIDVAQYTEEELHAAVKAAEAWGTYVAVHAYTPAAIQAAIRAGVKCIDHGQMMDEATAQMMAKRGIWLSIQPFLDDQDAVPFPAGSASRAKQLQMVKGTDNAYALAKKYRLKTAFGTDTLFDARLAARQNAQLVKLTRWYTPAEVLKMATADNAELLALSGPRNPYPGKLGVVEEGALADLLLVDGDPVADIKLLEDPAKNLLVIMKDGRIYKNTAAR
jgi:imidazolonepropionase-like amidohydrolase